MAVSKPNGGTQQWATYWAFGEDQSSAGTAVSRLKYTGREDDGNGLYQYRARYYDPKLGRFLSEDPIKFVAGINFYSYVKNNPINANDPSGNIPLPLVTGAIGAAAGGVGSAAGQIISNGGFDNFNWTNVGVATGVGFVAGVAAPYTAVTWLGAAATGAASNVLQYGITQKINGDSITATGVAINGVTGLVGGTIGGPVNKAAGLAFSETSPWIDAAFQAVK